MRAVVQRVSRASVTVDGELAGEIGQGLLVLLGVAQDDSEADADYLAEKIAGLRIFEDEAGKMNLSVAEIGGAVLAVSQFTLFGDVRRGKRPSFDAAARPEQAKTLYEYFVGRIRSAGLALRDRPLSGDDGSRAGQHRAGHHSAGFEEGVLRFRVWFCVPVTYLGSHGQVKALPSSREASERRTKPTDRLPPATNPRRSGAGACR